jgi:hypothetical protein
LASAAKQAAKGNDGAVIAAIFRPKRPVENFVEKRIGARRLGSNGATAKNAASIEMLKISTSNYNHLRASSIVSGLLSEFRQERFWGRVNWASFAQS